jgi:hypothetical protein
VRTFEREAFALKVGDRGTKNSLKGVLEAQGPRMVRGEFCRRGAKAVNRTRIQILRTFAGTWLTSMFWQMSALRCRLNRSTQHISGWR